MCIQVVARASYHTDVMLSAIQFQQNEIVIRVPLLVSWYCLREQSNNLFEATLIYYIYMKPCIPRCVFGCASAHTRARINTQDMVF